MDKKIQSLGGTAKAKKINAEYNANPNKCKFCGESIFKRHSKESLSHIKKKKFCNKSCAAKYNNSIRPSFLAKNYCNVCSIEICKGRKRCDGCLNSYVSKIGDTVKCDSTHPKIRSHSRKFFKSKHSKVDCLNCGYDKFTEVCHIKPVSEFPDGTLIVEINDIDNLIQLCRNCHWEFDKGLLNIDTILKSVV